MFLRSLISQFQSKIAADPLNPNLHFQYSNKAAKLGLSYLAYAELKTAKFLGADNPKVVQLENIFRAKLPDPKEMNHNQYFRFKSLSSEIIRRGNPDRLSILDVGGGHGELGAFVSEASYCLAEPSINGISGMDLPFPDRSFDYVVACHVLEHIPKENRNDFLDQLLSKARVGVILLNPFYIKNSYIEERLKLIIEVTNAQWAKEHLECSLPKIEDIEAYATNRGLQYSVHPNGTLTTTMAFVFIDYFAQRSLAKEKLRKINSFFNEKYFKILNSFDFPTGYLFYLGSPSKYFNSQKQN